MKSYEELEQRVEALERRVAEEAELRAAVDRDLADQGATIRATHHLVQALAITQGQHTQTLRDHGERLAAIERKIGEVASLVAGIEVLLRELIAREG